MSRRYIHSCSLVLSVEAEHLDEAKDVCERVWHTVGFQVPLDGRQHMVEIVAARSLTTYEADAQCSVSQTGDREWWCSTHRREAEECETAVDNR